MSYGRTARWFAVSVVAGFLAWLAFAGTLSQQELCLGAGCAFFSAGLSAFVLKRMGIPVRARLADLVQIWRVPWYLVSGGWEILLVLAKDLSGASRADSLFRSATFERRKDRRGFLRRVLAVAYTTVAPNFIVIGIDEEQGRMIFHQIARSGVPVMTKRLGARG